MKTLRDLAKLVQEKEAELAPGSETAILGAFVRDFDYVFSILDGDSELDPEKDVTDEYHAFAEAYRRMEDFEAQGVEYDWDMLW